MNLISFSFFHFVVQLIKIEHLPKKTTRKQLKSKMNSACLLQKFKP